MSPRFISTCRPYRRAAVHGRVVGQDLLQVRPRRLKRRCQSREQPGQHHDNSGNGQHSATQAHIVPHRNEPGCLLGSTAMIIPMLRNTIMMPRIPAHTASISTITFVMPGFVNSIRDAQRWSCKKVWISSALVGDPWSEWVRHSTTVSCYDRFSRLSVSEGRNVNINRLFCGRRTRNEALQTGLPG